MGPVLVDSSAWIEYLRGRNATVAAEVQRLLEQGQVVLVGVVVAELLAGARSQDGLHTLAAELAGTPLIETTRAVWRRAGRILFHLRQQGQVLSLADAVIAAAALEHGCAVYSLDEHFQWVPGLALHQPGASDGA